jgi:hypothetical protein
LWQAANRAEARARRNAAAKSEKAAARSCRSSENKWPIVTLPGVVFPFPDTYVSVLTGEPGEVYNPFRTANKPENYAGMDEQIRLP